jgi:hypothetical protein
MATAYEGKASEKRNYVRLDTRDGVTFKICWCVLLESDLFWQSGKFVPVGFGVSWGADSAKDVGFERFYLVADSREWDE